jgi:dihydroneopterin aldolase
MEADTSVAEYSDNLTQTVNYQSVYLVVKEEMGEKSKLLEHVSRRIVNRLFNEFPSINSIHIKLSKMNPPVGGKVQNVSFSLSSDRER